MKNKYLKLFSFILIVLVLGITGFMFFSYDKIQNDLYDKEYYSKYHRYSEDPSYKIFHSHLKSIDRDIPNYVSNKRLATNEKYDRVVFDNGQSYLVKNRSCFFKDNQQNINIVINKNNSQEVSLYPEKEHMNIHSLFYFGEKYKNYVSQQQIIKDCSAIPAN